MLGSPIPYLKGMRILMFQLSGFCFNMFLGTCYLKGTVMNNKSIITFLGLGFRVCYLKGTVMKKKSILFSPWLLQSTVSEVRS